MVLLGFSSLKLALVGLLVAFTCVRFWLVVALQFLAVGFFGLKKAWVPCIELYIDPIYLKLVGSIVDRQS